MPKQQSADNQRIKTNKRKNGDLKLFIYELLVFNFGQEMNNNFT